MSSHTTRPPILIVEPDLALRTSLTYQIRKEGYVVLALDSATLARLVVRENLLSLLVLDLGAFTCKDLVLCREMHANPFTERVPMLVLVSREREITQIEQMRLGVTDYLLKPPVWEELRACVQALMRGSGQGRPHRQARLLKPAQAMPLPVREEVLRIGDISIDLATWHSGRFCAEGRRWISHDHCSLICWCIWHGTVVWCSRAPNYWPRSGDMRRQMISQGISTLFPSIFGFLRQLLEPDPEHPQVIQTVREMGYPFLEEALAQDSAESMQALR